MDNHRIWRLRSLHQQLERLIGDEEQSLSPDWTVVRDLKRRKLQMRDALILAETGPTPQAVRVTHA